MPNHRFRSGVRLMALPALALVLGACERTVFEHPPAASAGCDPDLVGHWVSEGEGRDDDGEFEAIVDADCRLRTIERRNEGPRRSEPTTLHAAHVDGRDYLWFDAAWANAQYEIEPNLLDRDGDVYLHAYRVKGGRLSLAALPHRKLATRILARGIAGEVLAHDDNLTVRIEGDAEAIRAMLRKQRPFRFGKGALHFTRVPEDSR